MSKAWNQLDLGVTYQFEIRATDPSSEGPFREWTLGDPWGSARDSVEMGTDLDRAKLILDLIRKHYDKSVIFRLVKVERSVVEA